MQSKWSNAAVGHLVRHTLPIADHDRLRLYVFVVWLHHSVATAICSSILCMQPNGSLAHEVEILFGSSGLYIAARWLRRFEQHYIDISARGQFAL